MKLQENNIRNRILNRNEWVAKSVLTNSGTITGNKANAVG